MNILRLDKVRKTYNQHVAVDDVSFDIPRGCIFGMLGPNGAGKTSLIRIITSITRADTGVVYLNGEKLGSKHPEQIGYMPEERGLYKQMKVGDHLIYLARLKGLSAKVAQQEMDYWFERLSIQNWASKRVDELSKGMQQKIQFISTVIHKPKLLILDEPFSGLDPINASLIKDEIYELNRQGTSIIFSTHRMEQVEEICEHIVLINEGKNVLQGSMKEVKNKFKENKFQVFYEGALPEELGTHFSIVSQTNQMIIVQLEENSNSNDFLQYLLKHGAYIHAFSEVLPTLNEIFIQQVAQSRAN